MSGSRAGQGVGRPAWESQSARISAPMLREGQTSFPNFSKGKGGVRGKKGKKKKVAELFPQLCRGGGTGGRSLHPDSPPPPIWRLRLARGVRGREERAWGRGAALLARGIGSRRERVNFKSGAWLLLDGHAPSARPPARQSRSRRFPRRHPPRRGVRTD